jgi:hypothetical protein
MAESPGGKLCYVSHFIEGLWDASYGRTRAGGSDGHPTAGESCEARPRPIPGPARTAP